MTKPTVLVIGDCLSNGNNCYGHIVYNDPATVLTFSLQYHKKYVDVAKWFLQKRKQNKLSDHILAEDLANVAYKGLRAEEKNHSWPNQLENCNVVNLSLNGNHFGNYLIQLKSFLKQRGKPELILLTDHTASHMFVYFTYNGTKYNFFCEPHAQHQVYNPLQHKYPEQVHHIKIQCIKRQLKYRDTYQERKCYRYLKLLRKFIEQQDISYKFVLLRTSNQKYFEQPIDLTDLRKQWAGENEYQGELCKAKYDMQKECAERVGKLMWT